MKEDSMYFRNRVAVVSEQGLEIDPGSLWEFHPEYNRMVLVDDDEFHTSKESEPFEKVDA